VDENPHTQDVTYPLACRCVWCPKYRKHILTGKIAAFVEQKIRCWCETNGWAPGALNVQADHLDLFLSALSCRFVTTYTGPERSNHQ